MSSLEIPEGVENGLVGGACTKVGMLLGFFIFSLLIGLTNIHWYYSLVLSLGGMMSSGAFLKLAYSTV